MKRPFATSLRGHGAGTGFTLIELLVVVAIISLLMAVLLPALSRARSQAKLIRCCSNLRSLAIAWTNYVYDHNGRFYQEMNANIHYGGWRGIANPRSRWPRPLNPWVGLGDPNGVTEQTARIFSCPADRGGTPNDYFLERVYRANGTSYQTNLFLIGHTNYGQFSQRTKELDLAIAARLPRLNVSQVANCSRLVLMGDYGWVNQWDPTPWPHIELKTQVEWHGRPDHHCVAFLDGHVGLIEIKKGFYVTSEYCVLPFQDLYGMAQEVQVRTSQ
jgi:prepilin-type N-terminal cleavage/methylation domain-containing protein